MDTKSLECFGTDPRARGVRVEVSPRQSYILAHEHFVYSEFTATNEAEALRLVFVSHEVRLTGHLLRRLETAIQTRELAWVAARPERYRGTQSERAFVSKLTIHDLSLDQAEPTPANSDA